MCEAARSQRSLKSYVLSHTWRIQLLELMGRHTAALRGLPFVSAAVSPQPNSLLVSVDENQLSEAKQSVGSAPTALLQCLMHAGAQIVAVREENISLEDAFLSLTKGLVA